jgi:hypothetical protein
MSLRLQAVSDIATILTDTDDFGWSTTVTDPSELSAPGFQLWNPQVLPPYRKASRANRVNHGVWISMMFMDIHIRSRFHRPIRIEQRVLLSVF